MIRRRDWQALIHYGAIFFVLEKLAAVVGVSNLHVYAAMRGEDARGIPEDAQRPGALFHGRERGAGQAGESRHLSGRRSGMSGRQAADPEAPAAGPLSPQRLVCRRLGRRAGRDARRRRPSSTSRSPCSATATASRMRSPAAARTVSRRSATARWSMACCNAPITACASTVPAPACSTRMRTAPSRRPRCRVYPLVERHALLWIWMGDPALADDAAIPDFAWLADPKWEAVRGATLAEGHYELYSDNILDLSHANFVHPALVASAFTTGKRRFWTEGDRVHVEYSQKDDYLSEGISAMTGTQGRKQDFVGEVVWHAPATLYFDFSIGDPGTPREAMTLLPRSTPSRRRPPIPPIMSGRPRATMRGRRGVQRHPAGRARSGLRAGGHADHPRRPPADGRAGFLGAEAADPHRRRRRRPRPPHPRPDDRPGGSGDAAGGGIAPRSRHRHSSESWNLSAFPAFVTRS